MNLKNNFRKRKFTNNGGITLIALVITIIVLLILAGISIMMLSGDNSILQRATTAKTNTNNSQIKEKIQLAELAARTYGEGNLTYSKLNEELAKEFGTKGTGYNISDESENPWKITVGDVEYDISHGETAPTGIQPGESGYAGGYYDDPYIPINFEHKSGTTTDWNAGYTIIGKNGTDNAGDEFVWVPCVLDQSTVKEGDTVQTLTKKTTGEYKPETYTLHPAGGENDQVAREDSSVSEIRESVQNFGGFYIAKYEAGITGTASNDTLSKKTATDGSVKPLSQSGVGLWNSISRSDSIVVSKAMIPSSTGVKSTLISGECWDTTLLWITSTADHDYAETKGEKGWYGTEYQKTGYYGTNTNNIFDMGGNAAEWTTENVKRSDGAPYTMIYRGEIGGTTIKYAAATRSSYSDVEMCSFRVVLYK